jgi:hypothetical protein
LKKKIQKTETTAMVQKMAMVMMMIVQMRAMMMATMSYKLDV